MLGFAALTPTYVEKYGEVTLLTINRPAPEAECAGCRVPPTEIEHANSACARLTPCFTQC